MAIIKLILQFIEYLLNININYELVGEGMKNNGKAK